MLDRQAVTWLARAGWVAAAASGALVVDSLTRTHPRWANGWLVGAAWAVWGAALLALLVPGVLSLVVVRLAAAAHAAGMGFAAISLPWLGRPTVAVAIAIACLFGALSAPVGERFANTAAYGAERRFPLRLPAALVPPTVIATVIWVAALVGTIVLAAHRSWWALASGVALAALTWLVVRQLVGLASRWLVVLPAAVVVHDPLLLAETLMVPRPQVRGAALATVGTGAYDLSGPSAGHVLELTFAEHLTVTRRERSTTSAVHAAAVLVAPTRPAHALAALRGVTP